MAGAYQTSNFAYQGAGLFAYQDSSTAPVTTPDVIRNFSLREWRRWHKDEVEEKAVEIIAEVAARQVQDTRLDENQRLQELKGELELANIQINTLYIQALDLERERLRLLEISRLMRLGQENDNALLLILVASQ